MIKKAYKILFLTLFLTTSINLVNYNTFAENEKPHTDMEFSFTGDFNGIDKIDGWVHDTGGDYATHGDEEDAKFKDVPTQEEMRKKTQENDKRIFAELDKINKELERKDKEAMERAKNAEKIAKSNEEILKKYKQNPNIPTKEHSVAPFEEINKITIQFEHKKLTKKLLTERNKFGIL